MAVNQESATAAPSFLRVSKERNVIDDIRNPLASPRKREERKQLNNKWKRNGLSEKSAAVFFGETYKNMLITLKD